VAAQLDADEAAAVQQGLARVRVEWVTDLECPFNRIGHDVHVRRPSRWPPGGVAAGCLWGRTSTHA
jgi:hypothetical protein